MQTNTKDKIRLICHYRTGVASVEQLTRLANNREEFGELMAILQ